MNSREQIFAALFALASGASSFTTKSRSVRHWADVAPAEMPALFQEQQKQRGTVNRPAPTKWTFYADLIIYVSESSSTDDVSTALNNVVDQVVLALEPSVTSTSQTLGGLVTDCRVQGEIEIHEGRGDGGRLGIAVIPIEIIANV